MKRKSTNKAGGSKSAASSCEISEMRLLNGGPEKMKSLADQKLSQQADQRRLRMWLRFTRCLAWLIALVA